MTLVRVARGEQEVLELDHVPPRNDACVVDAPAFMVDAVKEARVAERRATEILCSWVIDNCAGEAVDVAAHILGLRVRRS